MSSTSNHLKPTLMQHTASKTTNGTTHRTETLVSALPMITKYAKIQPAVAIKPKPSGMPTGHRSSFNPQYDPQTSASTFFSDDSASNINVLRKWVLPARPRPGRKPVGTTPPATAPNTSLSGEENRGLAKKRFKGPRNSPLAEGIPLPNSAGAGSPSGSAISSNVGNNSSAILSSSSSGASATPGADTPGKTGSLEPAVKPISKQVCALQEAYLAKLKEQELIQNYIDTLLNQIKELRFVQSGMITVDALSSINDAKKKVSTLQTSDQLDQINNMRDLEKFLAHLTTQSNVIHSVTKKYLDEGTGARDQLQLQIEHYLRLRKLHRDKNGALATKAGPVGATSMSRSGSTLSSVKSTVEGTQKSREKNNSSNPVSTGILTSNLSSNINNDLGSDLETTMDTFNNTVDLGGKVANQDDSGAISNTGVFTPSLLRPLDIDMFEDDVLGAETVNIFEKLKNDDPELDFAPIFNQALALARKKLACGFCSSETPCLCFDAENIFGDK